MSLDLGTLAAGAAVLAAIGAFARWVWPKWRRAFRRVSRFIARADETFNGRPADVDAWGREQRPAVPSLGERMATLEDAVRNQHSFDQRLTAVETGQADFGRRLTTIESGHQVERVVGKLESTAAWNAVEAIASQPGDQHVDDA